jgi:hypothetical protein
MKTPLVIPMPNEVNTLDDVKKFFTDLKAADYLFHPDDDFTEYSNTSIDTGKLLNVIMQRCWVICEDDCTGEEDIYSIAMNILYPEDIPLQYLL